MAGTFTRSIFYKLDTSPNAEVQYTGVLGSPQVPGGPSPSGYRVTNQASPTGSTAYSGGANALYTLSPTTRNIAPTAGGVLSPTWPTTAGGSVTVWVQESVGNNGYSAVATSSASVVAISNPAVSGTQTFATTAAGNISHTPALSTTGAGGTLEYNATTTTTYSSTGWTTGALTVARGTSYYFWARRGIGVTTESAYSVFNGPFAVPYLATNLAVGTVSPAGLQLTGGDTSNVSVNWTAQANHTYRIIRNDLASPALVHGSGNGVSTGPITLLFSESVSPTGSPNSGLVDLPNEGVTAEYVVEVRRNTVSGGDGLWYTGTGTNQPFQILRILQPTVDDSQDFNGVSPTTISHAVQLKTDGVGGTLQFGWNTTGSPQQAAVSNWQSSPTFANAFTRGSTYYFYARRSTDAADFDVSTAQTVPQLPGYGLRIWSTDGSKIVFDTTSLPINLITCKDGVGAELPSQTLAAGATGAPVYVTGMTQTNGASIFVIVGGSTSAAAGTPPYTLTRQTGYFTVKNNLTSSNTFTYLAGRYK
jgi:hypothetical protein